MASIATKYPAAFEALWKEYPKWPKGRSVKATAYAKWKLITRGWSGAQKELLVEAVRKQCEDRASWQPTSPYGPQGLQTWLHQCGWEHEYETVADQRKRTGAPASITIKGETPWEQRGMTEAEWKAEQDLVLISGSIRKEQWETSGGEKRSTHKIYAQRINGLGNKRDTEKAVKRDEKVATPDMIGGEDFDDDIPF